MIRTILLASALGVAMIGTTTTATAQETDPPVVHVSQYQVPWERVDSLQTLVEMYPEWLTKAQELGHILDSHVWVHMQGDEWNVVTVNMYASWDAWANQESGWRTAVFEMVEPDSARRAEWTAGTNWVYSGTVHRDNIYRLLNP